MRNDGLRFGVIDPPEKAKQMEGFIMATVLTKVRIFSTQRQRHVQIAQAQAFKADFGNSIV
jgi:hypothetical protein